MHVTLQVCLYLLYLPIVYLISHLLIISMTREHSDIISKATFIDMPIKETIEYALQIISRYQHNKVMSKVHHPTFY